MASIEVRVDIERQGLLLFIRLENGKLLSTIDLKEEFGLSDDNAQWLLKKLDEQEIQQKDART